jgi:hypothetical protein
MYSSHPERSLHADISPRQSHMHLENLRRTCSIDFSEMERALYVRHPALAQVLIQIRNILL